MKGKPCDASSMEDVPLVMKIKRGLEDLIRRGMKAVVRMFVPVTLTSYISFQA